MSIKLTVGRGAEVILHIAGTEFISALRRAALEFVEDNFVLLAHDGSQNVQATTVWHTEHDFFNAERAAAFDDLLKCRNGCFATIKTETFCARIALMEELLERFAFDQFLQNGDFAFFGEGHAFVRTLNALLKPGFFFRVGNVHELDTDGRAVSPLQNVEHLANGSVFHAEVEIDEDRAIPHIRRKAV